MLKDILQKYEKMSGERCLCVRRFLNYYYNGIQGGSRKNSLNMILGAHNNESRLKRCNIKYFVNETDESLTNNGKIEKALPKDLDKIFVKMDFNDVRIYKGKKMSKLIGSLDTILFDRSTVKFFNPIIGDLNKKNQQIFDCLIKLLKIGGTLLIPMPSVYTWKKNEKIPPLYMREVVKFSNFNYKIEELCDDYNYRKKPYSSEFFLNFEIFKNGGYAEFLNCGDDWFKKIKRYAVIQKISAKRALLPPSDLAKDKDKELTNSRSQSDDDDDDDDFELLE